MRFFKSLYARYLLNKGHLSPLWQDYIAQNLQSNLGAPLDKVRFVVFDTETTGLEPRKDHIISIGAVVLEGDDIHIERSFECLIQRKEAGNKESVPVHQILAGELQGGLSELQALEQWTAFAGAGVLTAHFAWFDLTMLQKLMRAHTNVPLLNPSLDTIHLAKRLEGISRRDDTVKQGDFGLDRLCEQYGIDIGHRHKAAGDALATARLLQILLKKARKRKIRTLKDLLNS